jgi:hypothetical protein
MRSRCPRTSPRTASSAAPVPAGYSGTSQARKLGIKPGLRVSLDEQPPGWALHDPPHDIVHVDPPAAADVLVAFFRSAEELPRRLPGLVQRIYPDGGLWIAWPRRAAGHGSDISDATVREQALALGVVDVKVAAIDEDWSGLRLVWRRANRGAR